VPDETVLADAVVPVVSAGLLVSAGLVAAGSSGS